MYRNKILTKWLLTIVLLAAAVFPAGVYAATGDVTAIEFENGAAVHLYVAESSQQLKVLAKVEGYTDKKEVTADTTWISSDPKIVKVEKGLLTPLKDGDVTITAKYKGFTISLNAKSEYLFKSLKLDQPESVEYALGSEDITVRAYVVDEKNQPSDISTNAEWSSSSTNVATVTAGKLSLAGKGSAVITAKYKGLSASYKVNVVSPYSKLSIIPGGTLPTGDVEILIGDQPENLKAIAKLVSDAKEEDVSDKADWRSSDPKVATVKEGKITPLAAGKTTLSVEYLGVSTQITVYVRAPYQALLVTPSNGLTFFLNEGSVQVQAAVRNDSSSKEDVTDQAEWTSSNSLAVTVQNGKITPKAVGAAIIKISYRGLSKELKAIVYPTITAIESDKSSLHLFKGETASVPKINATMLDEEKADFSGAVEWTSSNEAIATVDNGIITAKTAGEVFLTAAIRGFKTVIHVTIEEKVLVLLPSTESYSIVIGKTMELPKVTAVRGNGAEEDATDQIEWTLSGVNAVIVDGKIKGLVKGSTTLKGVYLNQSVKIPVTVEQEITKLVVDPQIIELNIGKTKSIKVTGYYVNDGSVLLSSKVKWESSNPNAVVVNGAVAKAVAEGTSVLSGSYQGKPVSVVVKVVPKLLKLMVSDKQVKLSTGQAQTLNLTAEYDSGKVATVTGSAVWSTSKSSVVKVSAGRIEAVGKGSATVTAKFGGKTVSISVSVK
ncbi:hypothetical protein [Gorillibacterium massiliense]|uniref:hypothetical protein n=1 Tax=Gorillibacterium massiliense TaxID=1280390 RepID=UPI0004AD05B2|nr:hypothetical protein [Gorillibacterium massiliense]